MHTRFYPSPSIFPNLPPIYILPITPRFHPFPTLHFTTITFTSLHYSFLHTGNKFISHQGLCSYSLKGTLIATKRTVGWKKVYKLETDTVITVLRYNTLYNICRADPGRRTVYGLSMWPFACWDRGFEFRLRHGCLL